MSAAAGSAGAETAATFGKGVSAVAVFWAGGGSCTGLGLKVRAGWTGFGGAVFALAAGWGTATLGAGWGIATLAAGWAIAVLAAGSGVAVLVTGAGLPGVAAWGIAALAAGSGLATTVASPEAFAVLPSLLIQVATSWLVASAVCSIRWPYWVHKK